MWWSNRVSQSVWEVKAQECVIRAAHQMGTKQTSWILVSKAMSAQPYLVFFCVAFHSVRVTWNCLNTGAASSTLSDHGFKTSAGDVEKSCVCEHLCCISASSLGAANVSVLHHVPNLRKQSRWRKGDMRFLSFCITLIKKNTNNGYDLWHHYVFFYFKTNVRCSHTWENFGSKLRD